MEEVNWARFIFAFIFVLALIGVFAFALKRFSGAAWSGFMRTPRGEKRLQITETCVLSARHKLVLVKRDGVEHLILLGPESQTVIESGIHADNKNEA